jgi:hypothetical protein
MWVYLLTNWQIFITIGTSVMPLDASPILYIYVPYHHSINGATEKTPEVGATLASHNELSENLCCDKYKTCNFC